MPSTFSRTLNALKADDPRRRLGWLLGGALVLLAWLGWFFAAEVPVYQATPSAHLEVTSAAHPVDAPVGGQVTRVGMVLGQEVVAGQVLVELESEPERLRLMETRIHLSALEAQVAAAVKEIAAEEAADAQGQQSTLAALDEARSRAAEAQASAQLADSAAARSQSLFSAGAVAEAEQQRVASEARQRRAAADALERAVWRVELEARTQRSDRRVRMERLRREIAELSGQLGTERSTAQRLAYEVARRQLRAPVAGRLGEISSLRVGAMVSERDRIASVVPPGALRMVADYSPPEALGRIHPGQRAQARLDGFPWTQYGSIPATVSSVASEPRDGRIRVELEVAPDPTSRIPRQHGLTGEVEVEVERASPAALVLRAVGRELSVLERRSSQ